jgi:hypothetical protein
LAQAESLDQFQNTQLWLSTLAGLLPQQIISMTVKMEEIPRVTAEQLGVDPELVRSPQERADTAQKIKQAAEMQLEQGAKEPTAPGPEPV